MDTRPQDSLFSDETTTGAERQELRGLSRKTIAAVCTCPDGFDWLAKFRSEHLAEFQEPKSDLVIALVDRNSAARDSLLKHLSQSRIIIVDLAHHTERLIRDLAEATGYKADSGDLTLEFLRGHGIPKEMVLQMIREMVLDGSVVGRIESLLSLVRRHTSAAIPSELIRRDSLKGLTQREFDQLVVRVAGALGTALHPKTQAEAIAKNLLPYAHAGHVAMTCLESAVEFDKIFDEGYARAFESVTGAHDLVSEIVLATQAQGSGFSPGRLAQEDSAKILGLQAADIAAGYARHVFELNYPDTHGAAFAVRKVFDGVLLNDEWL